MTQNKKDFAPTAIHNRPHLWKWALLVVAVLVAAGITAKFTVFKTPATKHAENLTANQNTKGEPASPNSKETGTSDSSTNSGSTTGTNSPQPGDQKDPGAPSDGVLVAPSGNFISNHAPDQAHPTETSVCNTTPGASCTITFTKDGVTKQLPAQTTDRGGATYWNNWEPAEYGFTSGSWKVQATATLNGQSKTTSYALSLVIQ